MVTPYDRRLDRLLRWSIFLFCAIAWSILANSLGILTILTGNFVLAAVILQSWLGTRTPVLAYHSISDQADWLGSPDLTVPIRSFERQMQWLKHSGFSVLSLRELRDHRKNGTTPNNAIVLTFDDGYLDNWVAAEPILRKLGQHGTVFVSSDWIDEGSQLRPQLGEAANNKLDWKGYLNPIEIRAMANGGILDIQSHAVSHDTVFCNDQVSDFVSPNCQPRWLTVLLSKRKANWYKYTDQLPNGYPIFATSEALACPAFHPNPALISELTRIASSSTFFMNNDWRSQLQKITNKFKTNNGDLGYIETDEEAHQRWKNELQDSKQTLEKITGKTIDHLCWPRDAFCAKTQDIAFKVGYKSVTADRGLNDETRPNYVSRIYVESCGIQWLDLSMFKLQIRMFQGHIWVWPVLAIGNRLIRTFWPPRK